MTKERLQKINNSAKISRTASAEAVVGFAKSTTIFAGIAVGAKVAEVFAPTARGAAVASKVASGASATALLKCKCVLGACIGYFVSDTTETITRRKLEKLYREAGEKASSR